MYQQQQQQTLQQQQSIKRGRKKKEAGLFDPIMDEERMRRRRMESVDESIPQEEMRECFDIIYHLMGYLQAPPFNQPVDYVALALPDYPQIIKNPMDLGTIKELLLDQQVDNPEHFADYVRLVFRNAMTYNQTGSQIYLDAQYLVSEFEKMYQVLEQRHGLVHYPAPHFQPQPTPVYQPPPPQPQPVYQPPPQQQQQQQQQQQRYQPPPQQQQRYQPPPQQQYTPPQHHYQPPPPQQQYTPPPSTQNRYTSPQQPSPQQQNRYQPPQQQYTPPQQQNYYHPPPPQPVYQPPPPPQEDLDIKRKEQEVKDLELKIKEMQEEIEQLKKENQQKQKETQSATKAAADAEASLEVLKEESEKAAFTNSKVIRLTKPRKPLSYKEKEVLCRRITSLDPDFLPGLLEVISTNQDSNNEEEVEIDIEKLDDETLLKVQDYVFECAKKQPSLLQDGDADIADDSATTAEPEPEQSSQESAPPQPTTSSSGSSRRRGGGGGGPSADELRNQILAAQAATQQRILGVAQDLTQVRETGVPIGGFKNTTQ